ncbi:hypothetical protein [Enterovibrio paralichthyis]|uniref:hypothetical protein n=1 Tax=Enterovibrio paralichthyis TaxID=2853805 RepID=UPI001C486B8A|nr:hypothetical protein [Enterovibrio paralichthyis]MBV7296622.1 hypothetical protein [Enterovibrio paralichthyis]
MATFTLGRKFIINECSAEYDWVRQQIEDGVDRGCVIASIQRNFGGDEETAGLFLKIAVGESTPGVLLTHLSLSDWSPCSNQYLESIEK